MKPLYKILTVSAIAAMLFSAACTKANGSTRAAISTPPAMTKTFTPANAPTFTQSPSPTVSPTERPPWIGELYLDKNQSGERDLDEQGLSGYTVCVVNDCGTTDIAGKLNIPNTTSRTSGLLKITDPNPGTPEEMKQIIELITKIIIPAYNNNGVIDLEQELNNIKARPIEEGSTITSGQMDEIGLVHQYLGVCPVDLIKNQIYISMPYVEGTHYGIDIKGPTGTHIKSPDVCTVVDLYIDTNGENGFHLECNNLPVDRISLGHGNFSLNNYDTLEWYGIPISTLFNANGTPKIGSSPIGATPSKNISTYPNQDLHLYMGCTGACVFPHLHITFWTLINNQFDAHNDPLKYLNCVNP